MLWFRTNGRYGSWFALFALAIQLVLSFNHVHAPRILWPLSPTLAPAQQADKALPAAPNSAPAKPAKLSFDYCGICALINLAGSVVPTAAPALPLPVVVAHAWPRANADFSLTSSTHLLFQARAPPQA